MHFGLKRCDLQRFRPLNAGVSVKNRRAKELINGGEMRWAE